MPTIHKKNRQMLLGAQNMLYGSSEHAWRAPGINERRYIDPEAWIQSAKWAEKGKFHFLFIADHPAVRESLSHSTPTATIDPIIIVSQLIKETEKIGFVLTQSTTFNFPYTVARQMKALDLLSGGRIGWNAVTTNDPTIAANFGKGIEDRSIRYAKAHEFIQIVQSLWGSWGQNALKLDKESGIFAENENIRPINLQGKYYGSRGPLPIPESEQGQPILFQAGGGDEALQLAGQYASGVYSIVTDEQSGIQHRKALDEAAIIAHRDPSEVKLFMGISVTVADTYEAALKRREELFNFSMHRWPGYLQNLSVLVNFAIPYQLLKQPLPEQMLRNLMPHPYQLHSKEAVRLLKKGLSPFEVLLHGVLEFHTTLVGSAAMVADEMQRLFEAGACDGFVVVADRTDDGFPFFVENVIPILQNRGLYHLDYEGDTLRDHLGVPYQYGSNANHSRNT